MSNYEWPPPNQEEAEAWADEHEQDAIAYAAMWSHGGHGYGPEQAKANWPECPGFDFDYGLPDWGCEIEEEIGYEYRTVLFAGDAYSVAPEVKGWELVASFGVNPEPEISDENGDICGTFYVGEGNMEIVYRRKEEE